MDTNDLNDLLVRIGNEFRQIRHAKDEKMDTVAKALHIDQSVISKIENGIYDCLRFDLAMKLADFYHVSLDIKLQSKGD